MLQASTYQSESVRPELTDFEVYTGPIEQPDRNPKQRRAMIPKTTTEQLCLPYGRDDSVSDGPADRYFCLRFVRLGTSTWTYEGWKGQVYKRQDGKTTFAREALGEYCQYLYKEEPLFRTVGNDATFYRPPTANQLKRYLTQVPEGFEVCCKVWEEITIPTYAQHGRYGANAGQPNIRFLDAQAFTELVLQPYRDDNFLPHAGPFLFEFQRHGLPADEFFSRLDAFLGALPKDFRYAVETRNPGLLGERYARLLEKHSVAHVYNHWTVMPPLAEQHERMQSFTAPFTVLRLLTPLRMSHEAAKKRANISDFNESHPTQSHWIVLSHLRTILSFKARVLGSSPSRLTNIFQLLASNQSDHFRGHSRFYSRFRL